ncbi:2254_t:CDS:2, partial [Entrophospora sp. SA101]
MTKEIAWKRQTIETPQPSDNNFLVNEIINVDNPEEATNDTEFNFVNNEKNGKKFADIWNYISYNNSKKRVCKKCSYVFSDKSGNSSIERHMEIAWKRQTIETPQPSDNNFLVNEIINVDNPEEATNDTEFNFVNNEKNGKKFADIWNYISYNNSKKRVCKKCSYVFSDKSGNSSIERHM